MRISNLYEETIVDGPGLRCAIYCQWCMRACPGCHNSCSWPEEGGIYLSLEEIFKWIDERDDELNGITFCGGEPFLHVDEFIEIAKYVKKNKPKWDIYCFSGAKYEDLINKTDYAGCNNKRNLELLKLIDILFDGPFILAKRDIVNTPFRGSTNQRMLYLKDGKIVKIL